MKFWLMPAQRELEELGAKCAQRLGKNCTHVVLQHKTDDPAEEDRAADDKSARELAEKLETVRTGNHLAVLHFRVTACDKLEPVL